MRCNSSWLAVAGLALWILACGDSPDDLVGGVDAAATADADPNAPDAAPGGGGDIDAAPGGGGDIDAAPGGGGTAGEVTCGDMTCTAPDVCCIVGGGPGGGSASCTAADACTGTPAACDGPEDCAGEGQACCGSLSGSQCGAVDSCQSVVCHVQADCPTETDMCCDFGVGASICLPMCGF